MSTAPAFVSDLQIFTWWPNFVTSPRSLSDSRQIKREEQLVAAPLRNSRFLTAYEAIEACFRSFGSLEKNWDSYGAEPPYKCSIDNAKTFAVMAILEGQTPDRIEPSAEGGVAVAFIRGEKRAIAEFLNDGTWDLLLYDRYGNSEDADMESRPYEKLFEKVQNYLSVHTRGTV